MTGYMARCRNAKNVRARSKLHARLAARRASSFLRATPNELPSGPPLHVSALRQVSVSSKNVTKQPSLGPCAQFSGGCRHFLRVAPPSCRDLRLGTAARRGPENNRPPAQRAAADSGRHAPPGQTGGRASDLAARRPHSRHDPRQGQRRRTRGETEEAETSEAAGTAEAVGAPQAG